MKLVTLQRRAPVTPGAPACGLCGADIRGTMQDHLLVGQPGTAHLQATICTRCGDALAGLVRVCGSEICLLVQDHQLPVESSAEADMEHAPDRLVEVAESLSRTERALRDEAERLNAARGGE